MNEWSTIEVCESHGYDKIDDTPCEHHDDFVKFLEKHNIKSPAILDIGCCNGRVLNSFSEKNLGRYHGVDINEHAIDVAKNHWKDRKNVSFELFDIEEEDLNKLSLNEYDVVYIDSVLTMLSGWKKILDNILDAKVPIVYCNRTQWITNLYLDCGDDELKAMPADVEFPMSATWGGMKESHRGQFINEAYIEKVANKYNQVVIKHKEDDIDGNWFDLYAIANGVWPEYMWKYTRKMYCPLFQQSIREGKISLGNIIESSINMLKSSEWKYGLSTGRGVWFMRKGEHTAYAGVTIGVGSSVNCALEQLRNRKVIFISKDSKSSSRYTNVIEEGTVKYVRV